MSGTPRHAGTAPSHARLGPGELWRSPAGGAEARFGPGVVSATIADPALRAVDLRHSPDLRHVDLGGCAPGLHVSARGCPVLASLALPEEGPGAVLHLDFGPRLPRLRASGLVADLDACWLDEDHPPLPPDRWGANSGLGPLRTGTRRPPLSGLLVDRPDADLPGGVHFLVLHGGRGPAELVLPRAVREALLLDIAGLRALRMEARSRPAAVDLGLLPDLEEFAGPGQVGRLRVENAPRLARVDWGGDDAVLVASGGQSLLVEGAWDRLRLYGTPIRVLEAQRTGSFLLSDCPELRRLVAGPGARVRRCGRGGIEDLVGAPDFELEHAALEEILGGAVVADAPLAGRVTQWLGRRHGPAAMLEAIQILHALAVQGWEPLGLWEQRCALHVRSGAERGRRDDALSWDWSFPGDLADRGWEADLRLWRRCRQARQAAGSPAWTEPWPDPLDYGAVLGGSSEPEQLLALATATARLVAAEESPDDLLPLLISALAHGAERGRVLGRGRARDGVPPGAQDRAQGVRAAAYDRLRGTIRALAHLRRHPRGPEAAGLLCRWIGRRMPYAQGLDLLGTLRDLGAAEATPVLAVFAGDPSDRDRRQQAIALLMRPPAQGLFAATGATA